MCASRKDRRKKAMKKGKNYHGEPMCGNVAPKVPGITNLGAVPDEAEFNANLIYLDWRPTDAVQHDDDQYHFDRAPTLLIIVRQFLLLLLVAFYY